MLPANKICGSLDERQPTGSPPKSERLHDIHEQIPPLFEGASIKGVLLPQRNESMKALTPRSSFSTRALSLCGLAAPLAAAILLALPTAAFAEISVSVNIAPPPLVVY